MNKKNRKEKGEIETSGGTVGPVPTLTVAYDLYERYLEESDLTEDQKREFIESLWSIIVNFVYLGFGVHPAQQAQDACGEPEKKAAKAALPTLDDVECKNRNLISKFENATDLNSESVVEGVET